MGLSVSASSAILFVAFVICFGLVFSAITNFQQTMDGIAEEHVSDSISARSTAIEFTGLDAANGSFSVGNVGTETLTLSDFEVLVNGTLLEDGQYQLTVIDHPGSDLVLSGDRVLFTLSGSIEGARLMVVTAWGYAIVHEGS